MDPAFSPSGLASACSRLGVAIWGGAVALIATRRLPVIVVPALGAAAGVAGHR